MRRLEGERYSHHLLQLVRPISHHLDQQFHLHLPLLAKVLIVSAPNRSYPQRSAVVALHHAHLTHHTPRLTRSVSPRELKVNNVSLLSLAQGLHLLHLLVPAGEVQEEVDAGVH